MAAQSEPAALPVTPVVVEPRFEPPPTPEPKVTPPPVQQSEESKARIAKLESEKARLQADLTDARAELKAAKSQTTSAGGMLKEERERTAAEKQALEARIATLIAEKDRAEASRDQARITLASARARLEIYESTIREGAPVESAALQEALREAQKKVDMTVRAFAVIEQESGRVRNQLSGTDVQSLKADLETTRQALTTAQNDLVAEKNRSNNLARELARARPGALVVIDDSPGLAPPTAPYAANTDWAEAPAPDADAKIHVVADGENLSAISKLYYGTANRWMEIYAANRDVMKNENHLAPGMKLRIP
jgi:nucleoid-associated protein YgaU